MRIGRWLMSALVMAGSYGGRPAAQCGPGTVCAEYDAAAMVFLGRVAQVTPDPDDRQVGPLRPQSVTFEVLEDFKTGGGAALLTFDPAAPDARLFTPGETVLVYARRTADPTLWFAGCSRTRRVSPQDPELVTLRQLASRVVGASVEGWLQPPADSRPPAVARNADLSGLPLTAQALDGSGTATISTQAGGYFLFAWLKPGTYRIRLESPVYTPFVREVVVGEKTRCQTLDPITVRPR